MIQRVGGPGLMQLANNPIERILGTELFRALRAQLGDHFDNIKHMTSASLQRLVPNPFDDADAATLTMLAQFSADTAGLNSTERSELVNVLLDGGVPVANFHAVIGTHARAVLLGFATCGATWLAQPAWRAAITTCINVYPDRPDALRVAVRILGEHGGDITATTPEAQFVCTYLSNGPAALAAASSLYRRDPSTAAARMVQLAPFSYDEETETFARTAATQSAQAEYTLEAQTIEQGRVHDRAAFDTAPRKMPVMAGKLKRGWRQEEAARLKGAKTQQAEVDANAEQARLRAEQHIAAREQEILDLYGGLSSTFSVAELTELHACFGPSLLQYAAASFDAHVLGDLVRQVGAPLLASTCQAIDARRLDTLHDSFGLPRLQQCILGFELPLLRTLVDDVPHERVRELELPRLRVLCEAVPRDRLSWLCTTYAVDDLGQFAGLGGPCLRTLFTRPVEQIHVLQDQVSFAELRDVCLAFPAQRMAQVCDLITAPRLRLLLDRSTAAQVGTMVAACDDVELLTRLIPLPTTGAPRLIDLLDRTAALRRQPSILEGLLSTNRGLSVAGLDESVLSGVIAEASRRPENRGEATAASGAPYTVWRHLSTLTGNDLELLLAENRARLEYVSTFETTTEQTNGGDTSEYQVRFWDFDNNRWSDRCPWVVHIHRGKGQSRTGSAYSAAHLKRWRQRTLKEAMRVPVPSSIVKRCRET